MKPDEIPSNWVDLVTGIVLLAGLLRGRKRGMSEELLDTLQWAMIVLAGGFFYQTVAQAIAYTSVIGRAWFNAAGYFLIALAITLVASWVKRTIGGKLVGSDLFGRFEYYLGMMAGMVRFACIYFVLLNFLHAPYYSARDIAEEKKYWEKNVGDITVPTPATMQQAVYKESATGWAVEQYLARVLIQPVKPTNLPPGESQLQRHQRKINEVMGGK
ncbi:MAG: CvpA family protein [Verrucomicrobia bacterium]|nr:CvpA family protein [Verrucomicrobiota bacterium]